MDRDSALINQSHPSDLRVSRVGWVVICANCNVSETPLIFTHTIAVASSKVCGMWQACTVCTSMSKRPRKLSQKAHNSIFVDQVFSTDLFMEPITTSHYRSLTIICCEIFFLDQLYYEIKCVNTRKYIFKHRRLP